MYSDDATRLRHMLDTTREALGFASGRSRGDLDNDRMLALALARDIEIVGEAASHVSSAFRSAHPEMAWSDIIGMRNWLVHAYFSINLDLVWSTIVNDLPPLLSALEKIVRD